MPILTLNRYTGFTEDALQIYRQLYFKFPNMSALQLQHWYISIDNYSILYLTMFFKWTVTPRHCCECFCLFTVATIVFQHFHTVNISFENNILLSPGKRPVINGTNWLMCFVFLMSPGYFIILLLGSGAASCISKIWRNSTAIMPYLLPSSLSLCLFVCLLLNQQYGWLDLAARHHL